MKKIGSIFLLLVAAVAIAAAAAPRVSRATLRAMEKSLDARISALWDVPYLLIGPTRGVYLEGYGAVFTAEVNLVMNQTTLMAPQVSKAEIAKSRQLKLERIPQLKKALSQALVSTAASLDTVPAQEQIAIIAFLDHYPWEDVTGMPVQVTVHAIKGKLLEAQHGGNLDSVIQVTEN
jgi:hypothetical protein